MNIIPLFNDYCESLAFCEKEKLDFKFSQSRLKPTTKNRVFFPNAGLIFDYSKNYYSVVNFKRGGSYIHFLNDKLVKQSSGSWFKAKSSDIYYSNFQIDHQNDFKIVENKIILNSKLRKVSRPSQTPIKFLLLRVLALTLFRNKYLGYILKKVMAFFILNRKAKGTFNLKREILMGTNFKHFDTHKLQDVDVVEKTERILPRHMASQGYWQQSDTNHDF